MSYQTVKDITNKYLYGQTLTPENLADNKLITPKLKEGDARISIDVDANEFMTTGGGRFAIGRNFELIQKFFTEPIPVGTYTKEDLREIFGLTFVGWNMQQYNYQDNFDDYAERVYIYNSMSFQISDEAIFIVPQNGERRIENFAIEPRKKRPDQGNYQENFDLESDDFITGLANYYLKGFVDPSGIGRRVDINFINSDSIPKIIYNGNSFFNELATIISWKGLAPIKLKADIDTLLGNLFNDGVTRFIQNGKPILYGKVESDTLNTTYAAVYPTLSDARDNGVILIGGDGADTLIGDNTNNKNDILYGGLGNDTFYIGPGDIVVDTPDPSSQGNDQIFRLSPGLLTGPLKVEVNNNAVPLLGEFRFPVEQSSFSLAQDHFNYPGNIGNLSGDYLADEELTVIARPKPDYINNPTIPDADEQFLEIIYNATGLSDEELTGERTPDVTNPVGLFYSPIRQQQESYTTADGFPGTTTILRFKEGVALVDESRNAFYLRNEQGTPLTDGDFGITFPGNDNFLIGDNGGYDQWQRSIIADLKEGGLTKNEEKTWENIQYWLENTLFPNVVGYRQALVAGTSTENTGLTFYIENLDGLNRPIFYPGSTGNADPLIPNPTPTVI